MTVLDAEADIDRIVDAVDFVFCAVDMKKEEIRALEEAYARRECPVISNNSAHRWTPDVPMIIPELNPEHAAVIEFQRKRLGTRRGFIAVKSNCSIQSYVPALHPLRQFGIRWLVTKDGGAEGGFAEKAAAAADAGARLVVIRRPAEEGGPGYEEALRLCLEVARHD